MNKFFNKTFAMILKTGSPWRVNVLEKADGLTEFVMDSSRQEAGDVMMIRGDPVRHVRFGKNAVFEINAPGFTREAVDVSVLSKSFKAQY